MFVKMPGVFMYTNLLCLYILTLRITSVRSDETEITMDSTCSFATVFEELSVSDTQSYRVVWKGDFPFTGIEHCKRRFVPQEDRTLCFDVEKFKMNSDSTYLKFFIDSDVIPRKTYRRYDTPVELCEKNVKFAYVEIGGLSTASGTSGSEVIVNVWLDESSWVIIGWILSTILPAVIGIIILIIAVIVIIFLIKRHNQRRIGRVMGRSHATTGQQMRQAPYPTQHAAPVYPPPPPPPPPPQQHGHSGHPAYPPPPLTNTSRYPPTTGYPVPPPPPVYPPQNA